MRLVSSLFLLLLLTSPLNAATFVPLDGGDGTTGPATTLTVLEQTTDHTLLRLDVRGIHVDEVELEGTRYQTLSLDAGRESRIGFPEVPAVGRLLAIPSPLPPLVTVVQTESVWLDGIRVAPVQPKPDRCGGKAHQRFACNLGIYEGQALFPESLVEVGELGQARDLHFAPLRLQPVQFDPANDRIRIARTLVVRIDHPGAAMLHADTVVPAFQRLYEKLFVNYAPSWFDEALHTVERIAIITPNKFAAGMDSFVDWKRQIGFVVDLYTLGDIGSTNTAVKNHLQAIYDDPATRPTYVILVGDIGDMPTNSGVGGCASDFIYSKLAGMDLVSDVLVSRISVKNTDQLALQIEKFLWYEQDIAAGADSDWLEGATGISSSEGSGGSNDDVRVNIITGMQTDYGYDPVSKFYNSMGNDKAANISASINEGRGWVTYLGHGSGTSWATTSPDYSNSHINQLVNTGKLVTVMDVSCSNGGFDDHDACFAETWMRANDGGVPTGAVAIYSSSTPTPWDEPAEMAIGVVKAFLEEEPFRWGELCFAGRAYTFDIFGASGSIKEVFDQYVVFGDASLAIRSKAPVELSVDGPTVVPVAEVQETFIVTDGNGEPVADALVHLYKEGDVDVAKYTDSQGQVTFALAPASPGEIQLTVTAFDAVPHFGTIDVVVTGCGFIKADPTVVPCVGEILYTVWDQDLNANPSVAEKALIEVSAGGIAVNIQLTETGPDTNKFTGTVEVGPGALLVSHGMNISALYEDQDCDGQATAVSVVSTADCEGPVISNVKVTGITASAATISFSTDEPATASVWLGPDAPTTEYGATGGLDHVVELKGFMTATTYVFGVVATDVAGNVTDDDNGGELYSFTTLACSPACGGKECGPDGCGGVCGTCTAEQECNGQGMCFGGPGCETSDTPGCGDCKCEECVCAMDPYCCQWSWDDICIGECVDQCGGCGSQCVPDCSEKECGDDGCGGSCGSCQDGFLCSNGACVEDTCEPACDGKECGDDGCNGSCGACAGNESCEEGMCVCVPACDGKECGDDGCGGNCGDCEGLQDACVNGRCVCQPVCGGMDCGDDGCGGSCGECAEEEFCHESGRCKPLACEPDCEFTECGDDGCGGSCGECQDPEACVEGICLCLSQCQGKECGPDGCGYSCGECKAGFTCVEGLCEEKDEPAPDVVLENDVVTADEDAVDAASGTIEMKDRQGGCSAAPGAAPAGSGMLLLLLLAGLTLGSRRRLQ